MGTPNVIAYIALFLWIPVTIVAFARLRPTRAVLVTILGAVLFLPEVVAVDPPLLPPMDKTSITAFCVFLACIWKARSKIRSAKPFRGWDLLFVVLLIGNVCTSLTNPDALVTGAVVRPALGLYDSLALGIKDTLSLYLPFLIGRAMFRDGRDLNELVRMLTLAGVVYSVLALFEIRFSPQLHNWIYGFYQMEFSMTMRFGGYRPMIFMRTGMAVSMFLLLCAMVSIARWRAKQIKPWVGVWLTVVLVLCKSTGAIAYGIVVLPLIALRKRPSAHLPAVLAAMTLFYPALRVGDAFPTEWLVEQAESVNEERALSLWFRFDQELQLLERARERFAFGWGGYDRNRLFDPETGNDLSVTDGDWAIQIGTRGLVGFVALYGMLTLPLIVATFRLRQLRSRKHRVLLGAFLLGAGLMVVDLLPNGLFHSLPYFFAGIAAGLSAGLLAGETKQRERKRIAAREARRAQTDGPVAAPPVTG